MASEQPNSSARKILLECQKNVSEEVAAYLPKTTPLDSYVEMRGLTHMKIMKFQMT